MKMSKAQIAKQKKNMTPRSNQEKKYLWVSVSNLAKF